MSTSLQRHSRRTACGHGRATRCRVPARGSMGSRLCVPSCPSSTCKAADVLEGVPSTSAPELRPVHPVLTAPAPSQYKDDTYTCFREQHRIRGYEAGPDQHANMLTIANLLQECGANHGVSLWGRSECGLASMPGLEHLAFVATRMQIHMVAYPKWGDMVELETYYAEEGRLVVRRDWRITDPATGAELGAATSTWVTINMATRKLAKIPDDIRTHFIKLSPGADRHVIQVGMTKAKLPELADELAYEGPTQVARRTDMDANGHINNVSYMAWALETVPEEVYEGYTLATLEIDFKAECQQGDTVRCLAQELLVPPAHAALLEGAAVAAAAGAEAVAAAAGLNGAHAPGLEPANGAASLNGASSAHHMNGASANGAAAGGAAPHERRWFLHTLRKEAEDGSAVEVWRARSSWVKP